MKIYTVFLKDWDNAQSFSHLVGSFDSKEKFILALQEIEKELEIKLQDADYEVFITDLNKNLLFYERQIMK